MPLGFMVRSILCNLDNLLIFGPAQSQLCCVLARHGAAASLCSGAFCSRADSGSGATESLTLERVLRLQLLQL